jgi:hypothetical protein
VVRLAEELNRNDIGLPPTRLVAVHTNTARAHPDLGDRDSALTALVQGLGRRSTERQGLPDGPEVLRVLICLHRRSNPQLVQQAGLTG